MSYHDAAMELLKENGVPEREAANGTLWRLRNGKTVLVGRFNSKRDGSDYAWRGTLANVKRALRAEGVPKMAEPKAQTVVAPNYPGGGNGSQPSKLALTVQTKAKRIVLEELTSSIDLAPHQLKAMLARENVPVPDDLKFSVTSTGYVRVSWTSSRESVEE